MTGNRNRRRGKATERQVAKRFGGRRVGLMGKEDVDTKRFSIEVKDREHCIAFTFMEQAIANCMEGKMPLVVVHQHCKRTDKDVAILRVSDLLQILSEKEEK